MALVAEFTEEEEEVLNIYLIVGQKLFITNLRYL
jgi:hypothetical protein